MRYHRGADVLADDAAQLSRGGLLVRVDASLEQYAPVRLELCAGPSTIALDAQVVQVFPGMGVAVTFTGSGELRRWVAAASTLSSRDEDPQHEIASDGGEAGKEPAEAGERPRVGETAERIQQALRGNRDERAAILRDGNPSLQLMVLRNPGLQLDELGAIAKMRTVTPELLKQIADRREWAQRPDIAIALVRNPKTPVPLAIRMLDHVSQQDLRQLAKDANTRAPVQHAARKKVLG